MGAVISGPELTLEATYHVYVGGKQQSFTGTDVARMPGGFGGGQIPEGFDPSQMQPGQRPQGGQFGGGQIPEGMQLPEGFDPSQMPQGGQFGGGQMPEGFDPSQMQPGQRPQSGQFGGGQMPEGMQLPEGFDPGKMQGGPWGGTNPEGSGPAQIEFYMQDKVNAFSGIADAKA